MTIDISGLLFSRRLGKIKRNVEPERGTPPSGTERGFSRISAKISRQSSNLSVKTSPFSLEIRKTWSDKEFGTCRYYPSVASIRATIDFERLRTRYRFILRLRRNRTHQNAVKVVSVSPLSHPTATTATTYWKTSSASPMPTKLEAKNIETGGRSKISRPTVK